uniref:Uncharacterized protein n=1 Tax=Arundo donax TaxID=35708 RepID=A0A0A9GE18_ARUDO
MPLSDSSIFLSSSSPLLPFKPLLFLAGFSIPICFGGACASFPSPLSPPGLLSSNPLASQPRSYTSAAPLASSNWSSCS